MNSHTVVLPLVTLSCLLLVVAPAMAGPIAFNPPSGDTSTTDLSMFGAPAPDYLSTLHSAAPDGSDQLSGSPGELKIIGIGPNDPPIPIQEPNGIIVLAGSVLFGVLGLWRRSLKDLI